MSNCVLSFWFSSADSKLLYQHEVEVRWTVNDKTVVKDPILNKTKQIQHIESSPLPSLHALESQQHQFSTPFLNYCAVMQVPLPRALVSACCPH